MDGVRMDDVAISGLDIETVRAEDDVVADEDPGHVDGVEDRDLELVGAIHQGPLDLDGDERPRFRCRRL